MAILAGLAGMVLPSVRSPLDKARIRRAGAITQESLAKTRALAIRKGNAVEFRWEPGGRRFQIVEVVTETTAAVTVISDAAGASSEIAAELLTAEADPGEDSEPALSEQAVGLLREGWLPEGTQFAGTELPDATATAGQDASQDASDRAWRSIRFSPSGRASASAVIQIGGSRDFVADVSVRSLTAMAAVSEPYRLAEETGVDAASATSEVVP